MTALVRVTMRDDTLPHQIRLSLRSTTGKIAVSCTCLRIGRNDYDYEPIEIRPRWDADEAKAVWRAHIVAARKVTP